MLYLYDRAFTKKLQGFYPRVIYAPTDQFYQRYLESNQNQQIQLPALSLWRTNQTFNAPNARSQLNTPAIQKRTPGKDYFEAIYSMELSLEYQLDIWANTDIDRDDMMSELLYALTLYPNIVIVYRGQMISFPLIIDQIQDTTQINDFESIGDLYRMSIILTIEKARLFYYQDTNKLARFINTQIVAKDFNESTSVQVTDEEWLKFLGKSKIEGDKDGTQ